MFPIKDIQGRVIGFGARVLDDSQPKTAESHGGTLCDFEDDMAHSEDHACLTPLIDSPSADAPDYPTQFNSIQFNYSNFIVAYVTMVTAWTT